MPWRAASKHSDADSVARALSGCSCARALRIGREARRLEARIGSCCDNAGAAVDFCCAGLRC